MKRLMTHRGFTVQRDLEKDKYIDYPVVDALYHRIESSHDWSNDFSFLKDVIVAAKQILFNDQGRFILLEQLHHPSSRWVTSFALSSMNYINGVPRRISLENYRDLMAFHPKESLESVDNGLYVKSVKEFNLDWMRRNQPSEIISAWLAQEDGLLDLVQSLQLIGGTLPDNWENYSEADH